MTIPREEYNLGQERVHKRIDDIKESSIRTEASVSRQERMVEKLHSLMYGTEKGDGLITKVANNEKIHQVVFGDQKCPGLLTKVSNIIKTQIAHWWFIGGIMVTIFGVCAFILKKGL